MPTPKVIYCRSRLFIGKRFSMRTVLFKPRGEKEGRALARFAVDADMAAHLLDDSGGDCQAQAGAAIAGSGRAVRLHKRLEQAVLKLPGNADPAILDRKPYNNVVRARLHAAGIHPHVPASGKLDGVGDQVVEHLAQMAGVSAYALWQVSVDRGLQQ